MPDTRNPRDIRIDTATGVLITLVVLGHMLATMHGAAVHAALVWLYAFHMPAFVFLSGYVTRFSREWSPRKIITRLLFPYIVFALVQRWLDAWLSGDSFELKPLSVPWTLWYLLALMVWRLAVPLIRRLAFVPGVAVATAASIIAAGLPWIGQAYSLGRIIGFLPFVVAGLLWRDEWWSWLLSRSVRIGAAVLLVVSALWTIRFHRLVPRAHFLFSKSNEDLGLSTLEGMAYRAAVLVIAAALALSVISWAMRSIPVVASIGVASLTVYLLHAVVLMPWHVHGAPGEFNGALAVLGAVIASALVAWLLSRRPVVIATRPLMDLRWWEQKLTRSSPRA